VQINKKVSLSATSPNLGGLLRLIMSRHHSTINFC